MHTRSTPLSPTEVPRTTAPPKTKKQKKPLTTPIKKKQHAKTPDAPCRTHKAHSNPMPPVELSFVETPTTPITKKQEITTPGAPCRPQSTLVPSNLMAPMQLCFVGMPFSVLTPLVTHLDFQTQLVCHQLMSAFNVNRCRAKSEAERILGTEEVDEHDVLSMDPRMFLALHRPNALAMRHCMWKLVDEHMQLLRTLKLVCKDMNIHMEMDISILGGNRDLDLNTRSLAIRLSSSMFSDTMVPSDPFPGQIEASERVYVKHLEKFVRRVCIHRFENAVSFAALKMLYEDIAIFMVEKADEYHDLMGVGRFCQHDKHTTSSSS